MKQYILSFALISLTTYTPAYSMHELKAEQKEGEACVEQKQERDPFFTHFNFKDRILTVSHCTINSPSPRSLFSGSQTITSLEIDLSTGKPILEQAFIRSRDPKSQQMVSKIVPTNQAIVAELQQKAEQALTAWRAKYRRSKSCPKLLAPNAAEKYENN